MKTIYRWLLVPSCALAFLLSRAVANTDVIAEWNAALSNAQLTSGQNTGGRERADEILSAALVGAMTGLEANKDSGRAAESPPAGANLDAAAAQAAYGTLVILYPEQTTVLNARLTESLANAGDSASAISAGTEWGQHVAQVVLAEHETSVLLNSRSFIRESQSPADRAAALADVESVAHGDYSFSILAGLPGHHGNVDGTGPAARFDITGGIAVDSAGNAYVSERYFSTVRKITPAGVVTTFAGAAGIRDSQDGVGSAARFHSPHGLAADAADNIYIADTGNFTIRKIDSTGRVTTIAGTAGKSGHVDGTKDAARFASPSYVAVDGAGNVYAVDGPVIRKVATDGTVSTLQLESTYPDHVLMEKLQVDDAGNLYMIVTNGWDYSDVVKFALNSAGKYIGTLIRPNNIINTPLNWADNWAEGICLDRAGNLYMTYASNPVFVYTPSGNIIARQVAGSAVAVGGTILAVDDSGNLYSSIGDQTVRVGLLEPHGPGPVINRNPESSTSVVGHFVQFSVDAVGASPLSYQWYIGSAPIAGANQATLNFSAVQMGNEGRYHVVVSDSNGRTVSQTATLEVRASENIVEKNPDFSGGGSLENWFSLLVFVLLAAAAFRGRRAANSPAIP